MTAPTYHIDPERFAADPYPDLGRMRATAPVAYVPELGAVLITRRDDIAHEEKRTEVLSSDQPDGLVVQIMGPNMMRKDGAAHQTERRALFPATSPRNVNANLKPAFRDIATQHIARLKPAGHADLVHDFALPMAADALRVMTGLTNMPTLKMDALSQAMLDGCANYTGDAEIAARAHAASAEIDDLIDERLPQLRAAPDSSILSVLDQAGLDRSGISGNIKVIIGGGQNEPRDALAGTIHALMTHPDQHDRIKSGTATYGDALSEYLRWVTPIGMSPRRMACADQVGGVDLQPGTTVFLMFSSACRDEAHFTDPDRYDLTRNQSAAMPFGAGPHFCAGAAAARCMIAEIALPMLFDALPDLQLAGDVPFTGWAFRGPTRLPVRWTV